MSKLLLCLLVAAVACIAAGKSEENDILIVIHDYGRVYKYPITRTDKVDSFRTHYGWHDKLTMNGRELEDGRTWLDYGAQPGSRLDVQRAGHLA